MSWLAIIPESKPRRRTRVTAGAQDIARELAPIARLSPSFDELAVEAARAASNAEGGTPASPAAAPGRP